MTTTAPAPLRGIAAGIAAGLIASLAMDLFQKAWATVLPPASTDDPSTVKAAQKVSCAATGAPLAKEDKAAAGQWVHYLFGAGLGGAYGLLAEYRPQVTKGYGAAFGLGTGVLLDEAAVPLAGLSKGPESYPASTHAYSAASHLLFGGVTEGVRRTLRS